MALFFLSLFPEVRNAISDCHSISFSFQYFLLSDRLASMPKEEEKKEKSKFGQIQSGEKEENHHRGGEGPIDPEGDNEKNKGRQKSGNQIDKGSQREKKERGELLGLTTDSPDSSVEDSSLSVIRVLPPQGWDEWRAGPETRQRVQTVLKDEARGKRQIIKQFAPEVRLVYLFFYLEEVRFVFSTCLFKALFIGLMGLYSFDFL